MSLSPAPALLDGIDGVLFDVDDTLVDTAGAFGVAVSAVRRAFLPHVPAEREPDMLATWRADVGGHYRAYTRGELDFDTQRRLRADELHAAFGGPPVTEELYPGWLDVFWGAFQGAWRAHDDVAGTLAALAAAGLRLGIVSNARVGLQTDKLAAAGITAFGPDVIVGVDTFGYGKPSPDVFAEGCRRLGTDPARTAYVGDEPDIDAHGAAAAGLLGIWLDRPELRTCRPAADDDVLLTHPRVLRIETLADLA